MNRVSFQVEASRDVENDWVTAILGTTEEDRDPAKLADRINTTMAWALETAKAAKAIEVKSGGYQTYPIHDKSRIVRWRGSQDLILASGNVEAVSELIGELQSRLQIRSIQFSVSRKKRRSLESDLISEALGAFKTRAQNVRKDLDRNSYELVQLSINTGGGGSPRPLRGMARSMEADVARPSFEGGTSTLSVNVNGTIELR
ncbi:MAG: SIMPL domain-containing protein [bacterium]|nr:SIMPL domain-containing protein [bacterium]